MLTIKATIYRIQSLHHNGVLFLFDVKQQSINEAMSLVNTETYIETVDLYKNQVIYTLANI